jgi:hypothetical protein
MRESAFEKYVTYWENIAKSHPLIKSFYYLDEDELITGKLRSKIQYPCLFLEYFEPRVFDNSVNTTLDIPSGVGILSPVRQGDEEKLKEVLISHERIILDIISKMREDRRKGLLYMNSNNLTWSKVGKVFSDNCYGWRLDFKYTPWVDLSFNESDWLTDK